jgi:hypothetical protein
MLGRFSLVAIALTAVVLGACGVGQRPTATPTSTPTAPPPLTAQCVSTEAYANELIVAVIGEDPVPTAFDAINSGGCEFNAPVTHIIVTLQGAGGTQAATIALPTPAANVGIPLRDGVTIPVVDAGLTPGRYGRTVEARTADGRTTAIQGFEPVILVADHDSVQTMLLRAESRWERSGIRDYSYTILWTCECSFGTGPVKVTVRNNVVVGEAREGFGTIDALFDLLQSAIDRPAESIPVTFDEALGYPTEGRIDYIRNAIDDELEFRLYDFVRR